MSFFIPILLAAAAHVVAYVAVVAEHDLLRKAAGMIAVLNVLWFATTSRCYRQRYRADPLWIVSAYNTAVGRRNDVSPTKREVELADGFYFLHGNKRTLRLFEMIAERNKAQNRASVPFLETKPHMEAAREDHDSQMLRRQPQMADYSQPCGDNSPQAEFDCPNCFEEAQCHEAFIFQHIAPCAICGFPILRSRGAFVAKFQAWACFHSSLLAVELFAINRYFYPAIEQTQNALKFFFGIPIGAAFVGFLFWWISFLPWRAIGIALAMMLRFAGEPRGSGVPVSLTGPFGLIEQLAEPSTFINRLRSWLIGYAWLVLGFSGFGLFLTKPNFPRFTVVVADVFLFWYAIPICRMALSTAIAVVQWNGRRQAHAKRWTDSSRHHVDLAVCRAEELIANCRWEGAEKAVKEALNIQPGHPKARLLMAKIHAEHYGSFESALNDIDRAIESKPSCLENHAAKITLAISCGYHDLAVRHAETERWMHTMQAQPDLSLERVEANELAALAHVARARVHLSSGTASSNHSADRDIHKAEAHQRANSDAEKISACRKRLVEFGVFDVVIHQLTPSQSGDAGRVEADSATVASRIADQERFLALGVSTIIPSLASAIAEKVEIERQREKSQRIERVDGADEVDF